MPLAALLLLGVLGAWFAFHTGALLMLHKLPGALRIRCVI